MPAPLAIEFRVEPSMEHPHEQGFVLRIETDDGEAGPDASLWLVHGDWLEQPETKELRKRECTNLPRSVATDIFRTATSIAVKASPPAVMGFHATTYRLSFEIGFNSVSYRWWHELPAQWRELEFVVSRLTTLANRGSAGDA